MKQFLQNENLLKYFAIERTHKQTTYKIGVLFLDLDGVLNVFDEPVKPTWEEEHTFSQECLQNLVTLVKETGAKIVISSTWRVHEKEEEDGLWHLLVKQLNEVGLEIYDVTPRSFKYKEPKFIEGFGWRQYSLRGDEIQKWLDAHPEVEKFIILDDDTDMCHLLPHLIQTCTIHGFVDIFLKQALELWQKNLVYKS